MTTSERQRPPRIYYFHPLLAGPLAGWEAHVERISRLGFDHLLMPPPCAAAAGANLLYPESVEAAHPALHAQCSANEAVQRIAVLCTQHGLQLLLDVDATRVALGGELHRTHGDWFEHHAPGDALDPRCPPELRNTVAYRAGDDTQRGEHYAAHWAGIIGDWIDAGVRGVRCLSPHLLPVQFWQQLGSALRQRRADFKLLAWTVGLDAKALAPLADCGFDGVFSSLRWWDYRSPWLIDEDERLRRIARPIAFPEEPFGQRLLNDMATRGHLDRVQMTAAYRRAIHMAAAMGGGILVPMGFEYGMREALSPLRGEAESYDKALRDSVIDLSDDIREANALLAADDNALPHDGFAHSCRVRLLSGPQAPVSVIQIGASDETAQAKIVLVNPDLHREANVHPEWIISRTQGLTQLSHAGKPVELKTFALAAGGVMTLTAARAPYIMTRSAGSRGLKAAMAQPRVAIENVSPAVDDGRFAVKRTVGETVEVEADLFMDGHDHIAAALLWRPIDRAEWSEVRMRPLGNDRWAASFTLERVGRYVFTVQAWRDAWDTLRDELKKKHNAGQDVSLEMTEARALIERTAAAVTEAAKPAFAALLKTLGNASKKAAKGSADYDNRLTVLLAEETAELMASHDLREFAAHREPAYPIDADRVIARFASWYELFPRSEGVQSEQEHGSFNGVIERLPMIRDMGFDVLYFPPIHPIGTKHRKGRNNTLTPSPEDPGSPYAIGSPDGGHEALHPQLGNFDDFKRLVDAAAAHGLEIALDFAIQCSPDHPWIKQHPEWFQWRPDGTIRHAENPPKKYEDIVNVDFYTPEKDGSAAPALWTALRDVVLFWVAHGVKIFRVDNPHTKPFPFWQWMIAEVKGRYPETIFLSEAFTRPKVMARLAKIGFTQSYTYFTWRDTKAELTEYLQELNTPPLSDCFRPNFFVNTPDINPWFLQRSGRGGFLIRTALAQLLSGIWGMYNGFELCESAPVPGKEEYLDSEKYQVRVRNWQQPGNIVREITLLNHIRRNNPALQSHLGLRFHQASNGQILCFSKSTKEHDNVVMAVVSVDPFNAQETAFEVPLWQWGLPDDGMIEVEDLVSGQRLTWHGKTQHIRLDPAVLPFAIWRLAAPVTLRGS